MNRATRIVLLGGLAVGLMAAGEAGARSERLRWTHPDPASVDRYTIHIGSASRSYDPARAVVVANPPTDADNAFYADITVGDNETVFVALTASGDDLESVLSNERRRDPPLGQPGKPELVP